LFLFLLFSALCLFAVELGLLLTFALELELAFSCELMLPLPLALFFHQVLQRK
jgi:hypothetical protein